MILNTRPRTIKDTLINSNAWCFILVWLFFDNVYQSIVYIEKNEPICTNWWICTAWTTYVASTQIEKKNVTSIQKPPHVASCYHLPRGHHSPFSAWEHLCLSLNSLHTQDNTAQAVWGWFFSPVFLMVIHIVCSTALFSSFSTWEETLISGHSTVDRITSSTFVSCCRRFLWLIS